jgi:hypothetical protein
VGRLSIVRFLFTLLLGMSVSRKTMVAEYGLAEQIVELRVPETCPLAQAKPKSAFVL